MAIRQSFIRTLQAEWIPPALVHHRLQGSMGHDRARAQRRLPHAPVTGESGGWFGLVWFGLVYQYLHTYPYRMVTFGASDACLSFCLLFSL
jgi:hypothetical protein